MLVCLADFINLNTYVKSHAFQMLKILFLGVHADVKAKTIKVKKN